MSTSNIARLRSLRNIKNQLIYWVLFTAAVLPLCAYAASTNVLAPGMKLLKQGNFAKARQVAPGIAGGSNAKAKQQIWKLLRIDPAQANLAAAMMAKIAGNKKKAKRRLRHAAIYDNESADGEGASGIE